MLTVKDRMPVGIKPWRLLFCVPCETRSRRWLILSTRPCWKKPHKCSCCSTLFTRRKSDSIPVKCSDIINLVWCFQRMGTNQNESSLHTSSLPAGADGTRAITGHRWPKQQRVDNYLSWQMTCLYFDLKHGFIGSQVCEAQVRLFIFTVSEL